MLQTQFPKVNLPSCSISPDVIRLVPGELIRKYHFIPFDFDNNRLSIALENPEDASVMERIRFICGYELDAFSAGREAIEECIRTHVPEYSEGAAFAEIPLDDSNIVKIADKLFELAVQKSASDIHLEPQENGSLSGSELTDLPLCKNCPNPCSRNLRARQSTGEHGHYGKRLPQDGQFAAAILRKNVDFRVSTARQIRRKNSHPRAGQTDFALDLDSSDWIPPAEHFETLIQKPQGLLLVTGPTGSGKTTTLYSVLNRLRSPLKNVITLEDPIEYELLAGKPDESGITQVQVNSKIGMTFSEGLKASLRQDPDIVMVGEIRDRETAEIAMKASMTGHLVLSTLHTNDSLSTVLRLRDMGIEPYLISTTVIGVLAQRLVRVLCPKCRESYRLPAKALKKYFPGTDKQSGEFLLYRAKGFGSCTFTGYHGRIGIFELLVMTEELKQFIQSGQ